MSPPEGSFICEDCDTGRFPLYGEIVWVKLGSYRSVESLVVYSCANMAGCLVGICNYLKVKGPMRRITECKNC
jgi:hypothetical protein